MRSTLDSKASESLGQDGSDYLEMPRQMDTGKDLASSSGQDSLELLAGEVKLQSPDSAM